VSVAIHLTGCGGRLRVVVRHLLAQADPGSLEIVSVADPDPGSVDAVRALAPGVAAHASQAEALAGGRATWALIGSPNACHAGHVIGALEAGLNVFCEKPLATHRADCLAIRDAVRAHPDQMFFFGLVLRYSPFYRRIKAILDAGGVGRIVSFEFNETIPFHHGGYIHGNWRRHRNISGTHLLEKCCHDLDLANWLTGSLPSRVASFAGLDVFTAANAPLEAAAGTTADGRSAYRLWPDPHGISPFNDDKDIADNQVAILEYASGARATFHTNFHAAIPERRFSICGTKGGLRADALTGIIEVRRIRIEAQVRSETVGDGDGHAGSDVPMARHLAASMLNGAPPVAGLVEALDSAFAAFALDEAADTGRVVAIDPAAWGA